MLGLLPFEEEAGLALLYTLAMQLYFPHFSLICALFKCFLIYPLTSKVSWHQRCMPRWLFYPVLTVKRVPKCRCAVWQGGFCRLTDIRHPVNDTGPVSALAFEALRAQKSSSEVKSDPYSDVREHSIFITGCWVSVWATLHI